MCMYDKNIAPSKTCESGNFKHASVTAEYDNNPDKPALANGYNACNFKYKSSGRTASADVPVLLAKSAVDIDLSSVETTTNTGAQKKTI